MYDAIQLLGSMLILTAFVAATTAMHAAPFANSVAVGTEGCAGVVEALDATTDSVTLLRLVVAGAKPRPGAMLAWAIAGHTTATAAAEQLMVEEGLSFREAHHLVGHRRRVEIELHVAPLAEVAEAIPVAVHPRPPGGRL